MNDAHPPDLPDVDSLIRLIDAILADINIGLLVYHVEDPRDIESARLVYANHEASNYTGTDLQPLVGKYILEAFPALEGTDVPAIYADVLDRQEPRKLGTIEYGDEHLQRQFYAVRAFPMPNDCLGVAFENITLRKRINEMVKRQTQHLARQLADLEKVVASASRDLADALQQLQSLGAALSDGAADRLTEEERARLERIVGTAKRLGQQLSGLSAWHKSPPAS